MLTDHPSKYIINTRIPIAFVFYCVILLLVQLNIVKELNIMLDWVRLAISNLKFILTDADLLAMRFALNIGSIS